MHSKHSPNVFSTCKTVFAMLVSFQSNPVCPPVLLASAGFMRFNCIRMIVCGCEHCVNCYTSFKVQTFNDRFLSLSPFRRTGQATHPLIRTSQVSLSSNPDADFRYSTIFTPIGLYKGQLYAIKTIRKKSIDITRDMKKELKLVNAWSKARFIGISFKFHFVRIDSWFATW